MLLTGTCKVSQYLVLSLSSGTFVQCVCNLHRVYCYFTTGMVCTKEYTIMRNSQKQNSTIC